MISFVYVKCGNVVNGKQINCLLCPSPVQKCDSGSYSEASTVDPDVLLEIFSQPKKSHLPKDCFGESKNLLCVAVPQNEPVFKDISLEYLQIDGHGLPETLVYKYENQINVPEASTE